MNQLYSTELTEKEQAILDALEHYILFGQKRRLKSNRNPMELARPLPTGPLILPAGDGFAPGSIAVMAHVFYEDMCDEFARWLAHIPFPYTLLVSTDTQAKKDILEAAFRPLPNMASLDVRVTPNRGRDIAPMVVTFAEQCRAHDFVLHIHSKKSPYGAETHGWFEHCMGHLLHSPLYIDTVFRRFAADPRLGVFHAPPLPGISRHMHWAAMRPLVAKALRRMGLPVSLIEAFPLDFPAGSMMLYRSAALAPLLEAGFAFEDFPEEGGQTNDTLAHVIERLIFYIAHHQGYSREAGRPAAPGEYFQPRLLGPPELPMALPDVARPLVSIIVPVLDQWSYTAACLASIRAHTDARLTPYEIIVADDGSRDQTANAETLFPGVRRIRSRRNLGFLANCNHAAAQARGDYLLFLNNDTQVQPRWLDELLRVCRDHPDAAIVGSKLIYPDGKLQEAGGIVWRNAGAMNFGRNKDPALPQFCYVKECDYVSGAAMLVRTEFFRDCGGFDGRFGPAYYEDTDLAFQARQAGHKVFFQPASLVVHFEGKSHGTDVESGIKKHQVINRAKFQEKWQAVLERDHVSSRQIARARERSVGKPVIAVFDYVLPEYDRHAGARYTFSYIKLFLELGCVLKFFCCKVEEERQLKFARELEQMGVETHYPPVIGIEQYWNAWLADHSSNIDAIWLNRPHVANRHMVASRKSGKPILYFCHDLQALRDRREAEVMGDRKLELAALEQENHEVAILRGASVVYTPSSFEADYLKEQHGLDNVIVHPVYLLDQAPEPRLAAPAGHDVLFVGSLRHRPNRDGILWFLERVWPAVAARHPAARLNIVGTGATPQIAAHAGAVVIIHDGIADEGLARLYERARAAILPLRFGAGVKGKLIEAFAHRLPVVSTSIGLEGIPGIEAHVQAADTPEDFAARLGAILAADEETWLAAANALAQFSHASFSRQRGLASLREGFARIGLPVLDASVGGS